MTPNYKAGDRVRVVPLPGSASGADGHAGEVVGVMHQHNRPAAYLVRVEMPSGPMTYTVPPGAIVRCES
jgi:hypothetical protein